MQSPLLTVDRSPKDFKVRLSVRYSTKSAADLLQEINSAIDNRSEITVIDLSQYAGSIAELVCIVADLSVRKGISKILVNDTEFTQCRFAVKKKLQKDVVSRENPAEIEILGHSVSLETVLSFERFLSKIASNEVRKRKPTLEVQATTSEPSLSGEFLVRSRLTGSRIYARRREKEAELKRSISGAAPTKCYICHKKHQNGFVSDLHGWKHYQGRLCEPCSEKNWSKRTECADLTGKYAIVTGGRIKIGFEIVLKLLRNGAFVVATTRFAKDADERFSKEQDYSKWKDRLKVYQLELRNLKAIYDFTEWCKVKLPRLDILINNAAQTIARPDNFYDHLRVEGGGSGGSLGQPKDLATCFPFGQLDEHGQQIDLRNDNSWTALLSDVPIRELLEVFAINAVAPFILVQELVPLMSRPSNPARNPSSDNRNSRKFIVNVSAMEGQFARVSKTERHPHTNMAKAALNMFTRTTGLELQKYDIYMTAVDTGWVTDERPFPQAAYERDVKGFVAPLDCLDGAARVCDPVLRGVKEVGVPEFAVFLKDYQVHPW